MSESPEEKTIRNIRDSIREYQAYNQTSFMVINYEDSHLVYDAFTSIRKGFSAVFSDTPLVWWLRLIDVNNELIEGGAQDKKVLTVPMIQIHSPVKLDKAKVERFLVNYSPVGFEVRQRRRSEFMMDRWCNTIKRHGVSDLNLYFNRVRVRRIAITNK